MNAIEIRKLSKHYNERVAVNSLSLTIKKESYWLY